MPSRWKPASWGTKGGGSIERVRRLSCFTPQDKPLLATETGRKTGSYVFPLYNEAGNLTKLYEEVVSVVDTLDYDVELIFINDGSRNNSLELPMGLRDLDNRVMIVDLARNYGHGGRHCRAGQCNRRHSATGDAVIIMDSDLQDPPEVSRRLIEKWEEGYDVAYAQRRTQDTWFKSWRNAGSSARSPGSSVEW